MIPNQWYVVLESKEVYRNRPIGVTRMGEKLVFWRDNSGLVRCLRDKCAHRGVALSAGKVRGTQIQCPFHGFEFDGTGRCTLIPSNGKNAPVPERFQVQSYPIREAHGFIWLWWGEPRDELPPIPFFDDIDADFSQASFQDHWPVHYSRAIENQLDVMHLPFAHHNTIGRNVGTLVDGPPVEWLDDQRLRFYVFTRQDDGSLPKNAEELDEANASVYLDFIFPNLWQNYLSDKMRVIAAFVPVDEKNTKIYIRLYQKFVRQPLLRDVVNWTMNQVNKVIFYQDKRIVVTQQPVKTWLKMGENLVQGDRPIVTYRVKRQALLDAATPSSKSEKSLQPGNRR